VQPEVIREYPTSGLVIASTIAVRRYLLGTFASGASHGVVAARPSAQPRWQTLRMTAADIDSYLADLDEPKRITLQQLRQDILEVVPNAEECISYGMPAFRVEGKIVAGFAAFKNHLSYLPHSGSVLPALAADIAGYEGTKGSLHFPVDRALPKSLVTKLVTTRLCELGLQ
jgi:uncharacterized protein YdhG (YjbR/CyaY superfamily)